MEIIYSFWIAFSMYSKLPVPQVEWTPERMKYALCFFPAIGLVIGAAVWLWGYLKLPLSLSELAFSCIGTVLPILITGGIHLDGFLDVLDARACYQSRERRLQILQDPHIGAFAVIGAAVYLLIYTGLFSLLTIEKMILFCPAFVVSRALSAVALILFPKARTSGLASRFAGDAAGRTVNITMFGYLLVCFGYWVAVSGWGTAVVMSSSALLILGYYYRFSVRQFGGITGDLAGYFLQLCELGLMFAAIFL